MAVVRELITFLGFDIEDKKLKDLDESVSRVKNGILGLSASIIGAGGIIFGFLKTSAHSADQLYKLAAAAGVGVEDMQRLGYAASVSGASMEELGTGLKFLSKNMYEVSKNASGETAKGFQKLGVKATDANGNLRTSAEVVLEVADRFKAMKNPTEKAALAMQVFGRSGGGLVEFLSQGSQQIREISAELDAFGGVMSEEQVLTLKEFNDGLTRTWKLITAIKDLAAAELAPEVTEVVKQFREFLIVNKDIIKANLIGFVKGLSGFLKNMWRFVRALGQVFLWLSSTIGGTEKITKALLYAIAFLSSTAVVGGILSMIAAFKALGLTITAATFAPFLLAAGIVTAAAAIFLIIEDIIGYFQGRDSVTGILVKGFTQAFDDIKAQFSGFADWFVSSTEGMVQKILKTFVALNPLTNIISLLTGNGLPAAQFLGSFGKGGSKTETMSNDELAKFGGVTDGRPEDGNPIMNFLNGMIGSGGGQAAPTWVEPPTMKGLETYNPGDNGASVNVNAPISVTVPPGTDPATVGDRVQQGVGDAMASILRQAHRATA